MVSVWRKQDDYIYLHFTFLWLPEGYQSKRKPGCILRYNYPVFPTRFKNRHCRNYEPIDFDSGFCHFHQKIVLAEGDTCQYFDRFPRCQNCKFYSSSVAGYLGTCQAWPSAPMTFPDMLSASCEHFEWQIK